MLERRNAVEQMNQPAYEEEVRGAANWLRKKADGVFGIPTISVMISPEYARWIAERLENHADDVQHNHG
jgi:hypothetical protein